MGVGGYWLGGKHYCWVVEVGVGEDLSWVWGVGEDLGWVSGWGRILFRWWRLGWGRI